MNDAAPRLLDHYGLADVLGVSRSTVDSLRKQGRIPFVQIGPKTIRFEPGAVVEALRGDQQRACQQHREGVV